MDAPSAFVAIFFMLVTSIVLYRVVEGLFPTPPAPPRAPRTDFEVLTDAITEELERLHGELNNLSSSSAGYEPLLQEIGRLNQKLANSYQEMKSESEGQGVTQ